MNDALRPAILYVTEQDRTALRKLFATVHPGRGDGRAMARLREELERATIVRSGDVPAGVITLNSRARIADVDTGTVAEYTLVLPLHADIGQGRVSVLAPVGTALLGQQEGDVVEWTVPAGRKRFRVEAVLYQPEASEPDSLRAVA